MIISCVQACHVQGMLYSVVLSVSFLSHSKFVSCAHQQEPTLTNRSMVCTQASTPLQVVQPRTAQRQPTVNGTLLGNFSNHVSNTCKESTTMCLNFSQLSFKPHSAFLQAQAVTFLRRVLTTRHEFFCHANKGPWPHLT